MAKLVVLSAGLNGRTHDLNVDKTTIGRVEDNTFQIADPSVSSHHCEVILRGSDVVIKDLNSTNGSFINGEKISESVLKPAPAPAPASGGSAPATPAASTPRKMDSTMVVPRGVNLNELSDGTRGPGFDTTSKGFSKKKNNTNMLFLYIGIGLVVIIGIVLIVVFSQLHH
jgi:hypothetical protein